MSASRGATPGRRAGPRWPTTTRRRRLPCGTGITSVRTAMRLRAANVSGSGGAVWPTLETAFTTGRVDRGSRRARGTGRGGRMSELPSGVVTFLFTDIEGSTRLVKTLRERYPQILAEHQRLVRAAVASHGGHEVDT